MFLFKLVCLVNLDRSPFFSLSDLPRARCVNIYHPRNMSTIVNNIVVLRHFTSFQ